jgi:hypothetical protein
MEASMPTAVSTPDRRERVAAHLDGQARACALLGSPLYTALLAWAADDTRSGGVTWRILATYADGNPDDDALALRLMAAVHRLVLTRDAPRLALHYPSVGGSAGVDGATEAFAALLAERPDDVRDLVALRCQTNEVGRCAALVLGFLTVADETRLPLRVLEVGASAGLNLRWDRYRYGRGNRGWGDVDAPVRLDGDWDAPDHLLDTRVAIAERRGCDPAPIDPLSDAGRLALTASVWADQVRRFERLRGALAVAAAMPVTVDTAPVAAWLPERLFAPAPGVATVVYHSVVLQYLGADERATLHATVDAAGAGASADAPLAWLRMEPERPLRAMAVRLTTWPGGRERLLATAGAHGDPVRWQEGGG